MAASPGRQDPLIGTSLGGRYHIIGRVNRGGTAVVYRVQDTKLDRIVAAKVIHADYASDPDYLHRFDREAQAAANLSDPNVVTVLDRGYEGDRPFLIMEYVRGQNLRQIISARAPLPPLEALTYAEAIAQALATAHAAGIIHRDIKPENVLVTPEGQIKVTDFGLARATTAQTTTASQGVIMGTISYLAPELTHQSAQAASDVYSAGIVMFELLTGQKPHTGEDFSQVILKHMNDDVSAPSSLLTGEARKRIPDYVDAVVLAATSRDLAKRPADGSQLARKVTLARRALQRGVLRNPTLAAELGPGGVPSRSEQSTSVRLPVAKDPLSAAPTTAPAKGPAGPTPAATTPRLTPTTPAPPAAASTSAVPPRPASGGLPSSPASSNAPIMATRSFASSRPGPAVAVAAPTRPVTPATTTPSPRTPLEEQRDTSRRPSNPLRPAETRPAADGRDRTRAREERTPVQRLRPAAQPAATRVTTAVPSGKPRPLIPISKDPRYVRRRRGLLLLLILVLLAVAGGSTTYWWFAHGRWAETPGLQGTTEQVATTRLAGTSLTLRTVPEYSETVAAGVIIRTDPAEGARILKNGTVTAYVSQGPERYTVPPLIGQTREAASAALESAHLTVGAVTEDYADASPAGTVIDASAQTGDQLKRDQAVDLVVSKGPEPIPIPDVTTKTQADAESTLKGLGFQTAVSKDNSSTIPAGHVISQDPSTGAGTRNQTINIVVSKGPIMVTVPAVRNMSRADATTALTQAGFKVNPVYLVDSGVALGLATGTVPAADTTAPLGSTVTLNLV